MPVISRSTRIKQMTEPHQYFSIGEVFGYTPIDRKEHTRILTVVQQATINCAQCDIFWACERRANCVSGERFIPACSALYREDGENVIFKEI